MERRESFVFYTEWADILRGYGSQVRIEVYDAVIEYAASGTLPDLKENARIAFDFIRRQIDRNIEKREYVSSIRSAAGKIGGQANLSKFKQNEANGSKTKQTEAKASLNVNGNVYGNDNGKDKKEKDEKENVFAEYTDEWIEVFEEWLAYKSERKESYKGARSLKAMARKLYNLSNGNVNVARGIIEQSMANNWQGFFALKGGDVPETPKEEAKQVEATLWEQPNKGEGFDDWKRRVRSSVSTERFAELVRTLWR